ncbi:hypothetical protein [Aquirufa sp.]|jgi:uncharacterized membrane protein|uniref:hypothetical protein n=1 Tax=Aquirufa sp. TaxID=2676249 RepID=UPI0037C1522A
MQWGAYFAVMAASSIKFVAGPLTGFGLGLSMLETIVCTWVGMMFTVTVMLTIGRFLVQQIARIRIQKPKLFSGRVRYAVSIWQRFGIKGIAVMTPLLFTPIGGSLLALSFKVPTPRVLFFMAISGIFWSIVFTVLFYQLTFVRDLIIH